MKKLILLCLLISALFGVAKAQFSIISYNSVDYPGYNLNTRIVLWFYGASVGQTINASIYSTETQGSLNLGSFTIQPGDAVPNQLPGLFEHTFLVTTLPTGVTFPAPVQFVLTDPNNNTAITDTIIYTNNPSSLTMSKPTGGSFVKNTDIQCVFANENLPNDVTVEYAPFGTNNYTELTTTANPPFYYANIPTLGLNKIRVRNLSYMDSTLVNIVDDTPQYFSIINPQPGDLLSPGLTNVDTILIQSNMLNSFSYAYVFDANDNQIAVVTVAQDINSNPSETGIMFTYKVISINPDTIQCSNCKLIVFDETGSGLSDTVQVVLSNNTISGRVYYDYNNNGLFDGNDIPYSSPLVSVAPANGQLHTYADGTYRYVAGSNGNFTITPPSNIFCPGQTLPASQLVTLAQGNSNLSDIDFRIVPNGGNYEMTVAMPTNFITVGGTPIPQTITVSNNGGSVSLTGTLTLDYNETLQHYVPVNGFTVPDVNNDNTGQLVFNIPALAPCQTYTIVVGFLGTAPDGTLIPNNLTLSYDDDANPNNNSTTSYLQVNASYDPNDKTVDKSSTWAYDLVDLNYLIRFQNTGSAMAYNIAVVDTLSSYFDMSTIRVNSASHPYTMVVNDNNVVEFRFNNIQLPDSASNEPASHGFVSFNIKADNLEIQPFMFLNNTADIYFDFNEPIRTNTASTFLEGEGIDENKFTYSVYPNPAKDILWFMLPTKTSGKLTTRIADLNGRVLKTTNINLADTNGFNQDISWLANGVYFITLNIGGTETTQKLVVLH